MSAGQPNWSELERMGKLPKERRHLVPGATERGELQDKVDGLTARLKLAISLMTVEQKKEFGTKLDELKRQERGEAEEPAETEVQKQD